jgi:poly(3-hydroxyalkanoate) synthetase
MINRPYIFDLLPETSLVKTLLEAGHGVYVLDWGTPAADGQALTVETAITEHIVPALAEIAPAPAVLGYCMGGLLALAAAQLVPEKVSRLVFAATPWDFAPTRAHDVLIQTPFPLETLLADSPLIPVDMVQTAFVSLDPVGAARRLQAFAQEADQATLNRLAAIEDWLADGVALEPAVAKTLLLDWYRDNLPVQGLWQVAGEEVDPAKITAPTFVVVPTRDTLVPPAGAMPLAEKIPHATVQKVATGHVGLMAGRHAGKEFFDPLVSWLR